MNYNWQLSDWPNFVFRKEELDPLLVQFNEAISYLKGSTDHLSDEDRFQIALEAMVEEALTTSAIEGEFYSRKDVFSSIANNLDAKIKFRHVADLRARGIGDVITLNRKTAQQTLTHEVLFEWHRLLLFYRTDLTKLGGYRTGKQTMQIVSGAALHRQEVHFEAPPSGEVSEMMDQFLQWYHASVELGNDRLLGPLHAGVAHAYFESIHPFEDGNGRIGRVLIDKALAQHYGYSLPMSVSAAIAASQSEYYKALQSTNRSLDWTAWLHYFLKMLITAVEMGQEQTRFVIQKTKYFQRHASLLNERQEKAIGKMFEAGPGGFTGGMSKKKYMSITRTSAATATRDLQHLLEIGALLSTGGGRSVRYQLNHISTAP